MRLYSSAVLVATTVFAQDKWSTQSGVKWRSSNQGSSILTPGKAQAFTKIGWDGTKVMTVTRANGGQKTVQITTVKPDGTESTQVKRVNIKGGGAPISSIFDASGWTSS